MRGQLTRNHALTKIEIRAKADLEKIQSTTIGLHGQILASYVLVNALANNIHRALAKNVAIPEPGEFFNGLQCMLSETSLTREQL